MNIQMVKKGICVDCRKPATKIIDGECFCAFCGDGVLIKTISKCIKATEQAVITISIKPKGILEKMKSKISKGE
jgi:uncharacterized Zn finger protein (UPF0148 family)